MLSIQPNLGLGEVFYPQRIPASSIKEDIIIIEDEPTRQRVFRQQGGIVIKENSEALQERIRHRLLGKRKRRCTPEKAASSSLVVDLCSESGSLGHSQFSFRVASSGL
ncbi:hypothetical protein ACET3Z_021982 [Daucus carota]